MVYEHEDIVGEDIDQQMAQSNNVGSSSRSHDREMQVQRKKIVRIMWEDYNKDQYTTIYVQFFKIKLKLDETIT